MEGLKKPPSNSSRHSLRCATLLNEEGKSLPCVKGGADHREAEGLYQTAKGGTTIIHYSSFILTPKSLPCLKGGGPLAVEGLKTLHYSSFIIHSYPKKPTALQSEHPAKRSFIFLHNKPLSDAFYDNRNRRAGLH